MVTRLRSRLPSRPAKDGRTMRRHCGGHWHGSQAAVVGDLTIGRFPVEVRAAHRSDLLRGDKLLRWHGAVHRIGGLDVSGAVAAIRERRWGDLLRPSWIGIGRHDSMVKLIGKLHLVPRSYTPAGSSSLMPNCSAALPPIIRAMISSGTPARVSMKSASWADVVSCWG
jgi:hypothetical protein